MQRDFDPNFLTGSLEKFWDGKKCVLHLKEETNQWRQNEWPGFYFEHVARKKLTDEYGGSVGPVYGNVTFDYEQSGKVWDFKAHSTNAGQSAIFNDVEAVDLCLAEFGHIGWIVACGEAIWDEDQEFKQWHNQLKGKKSAYSADRERRGAPSRRRKSGFILRSIELIEFYSQDQIEQALSESVLKGSMQKGMRNSNGKPRQAKYGVDFSKLPGSSVEQEGRWMVFDIN